MLKRKKIEESLLFNDLKNPKFAARYLQEILNQDDFKTFLIALNNIAKANGGINLLSKKTNLGRESLYKSLSEEGNPYFSTINTILKSLGLKIAINVNDQKVA